MKRRNLLRATGALAAGLAGCSSSGEEPSGAWTVSSADVLVQDNETLASVLVCNDANMSNGNACLTVKLLDENAEVQHSRQVYWMVDDEECEAHYIPFDDVPPSEAMGLRASATITQINDCPGTNLEDQS